jgi:hypothetical protein
MKKTPELARAINESIDEERVRELMSNCQTAEERSQVLFNRVIGGTITIMNINALIFDFIFSLLGCFLVGYGLSNWAVGIGLWGIYGVLYNAILRGYSITLTEKIKIVQE